MPNTIHFLGRVLLQEKIGTLTIHHRARSTWSIPEIGITPIFEVFITESKIDVAVEVDKYDPAHLPTLYTRAQDLTRVSINLAVFASGYGFRFIIDTAIMPDGVEVPIVVNNPKLPPLCTAYRLGDSTFNDMHLLILNNIRLNFILNDIVGSMTVPHSQAINCTRAMDGIKHFIAPNEKYDKNAWQKMRNTLNLDQAYIQMITDLSRDARHGKIPVLPDPDTLMTRSWTIMNRFLEYLKHGGQHPLSIMEFPLLTG